MLHRLMRNQYLPITPTEAWSFFSNPNNLHLITPPWLDLTITGEVPETVYPGLIITYTLRPLRGISRHWVTEITHVGEPLYFVDEQRLGPFELWHHRHHFHARDGGVEIEDRIHYALPFGPIGDGVHRFLIRRRLESIFEFREKTLKSLFPQPPRKE